MQIGTITCSYFMRIYGYRKPEDFQWSDMTAKYRAEFTRADFLQMAREIRDLGYDGIEVWEPNFSHMVYSADDAREVGRELEAMGFRQVAYCIGGWGAGDVAQVEPAYRFAKALGSHVVTGCLEKGADQLLAEMERWGKELGVKYAIENHPEPNLESPREIADVIARFETIGANVDTGIYHMQGYDILEAADLFGDKIYHVHFKDTKVGEEDCQPLGQGTAPLVEFLHKLAQRNYGEMVSVEFEFVGDPAPGLAESLQFIQKSLG